MPHKNAGLELWREHLVPGDTEATARAIYTAVPTSKPNWDQLGEVTRSVWRERAVLLQQYVAQGDSYGVALSEAVDESVEPGATADQPAQLDGVGGDEIDTSNGLSDEDADEEPDPQERSINQMGLF